MRFKRWMALCLAVCLALAAVAALAACGDKTEDSSASRASSSRPQEDPPESEDSSAPANDIAPAPEGLDPSTLGAAPAGKSPLTGLDAPEGFLEGQRPVAVMVNNTVRALPQRGLGGKAEVVVEMPVGDGETSLMALYSDYRALPAVGPVAEMQDQFAQFALPLQAIPAYIKSTQYAANLFTVLGYKTLNGIQLGTTSFWFDQARTLPKPGGHLHEYSWYTDATLVYAGFEFLDINVVGEVPSLFSFTEAQPENSGDAAAIEVIYSGRQVNAFRYKPEDNLYGEYVNGARRVGDDEGRSNYNNVIILSCLVGEKEDSDQYLEFNFSGGDGWYFAGGNVQRIKWQKGGPTAQLQLYDENNQTLQVQAGTSYIGFVPTSVEDAVTWKTAQQVADEEAEDGDEG